MLTTDTHHGVRRIAVFASGTGSNAENLIRHFNCGKRQGAEVALVVCNRPEAGVIGKAERLGVPVAVMTRSEINDAAQMLDMLDSHSIDMIVLAGFLLMVPEFLVKGYRGRIINIHPSLLPKFGGKGMYGANVHRAVIEAGETQTGITIHHVSERYDEGQIIFQATVEIAPDDTPETVESKIHRLERDHYPRVVSELIP